MSFIFLSSHGYIMKITNSIRSLITFHHYLMFAAISGAAAVIIGAFGAHGLEKMAVADSMLSTYDTAVKYHFIHTLLLCFMALTGHMAAPALVKKWLWYGALFLVFGIIGFSGSLYLLVLFHMPILGIITPFGGFFWIVAWLCLGVANYHWKNLITD
jgi:uncharacterized membrane protein YgdD (TMEM256/DUF423 family)